MYELIVGGYIPGTNIQISYQAWIAFCALLFGIGAIVWLEYKDAIYKLLDMLNFDQSSTGLHATELHTRLQYSA